MTVLMQEVIDRVQTLPERKLEALLTMLSNDEYDEDTMIVEKASPEESARSKALVEKYKDSPEEWVSLNELKAMSGSTRENLAKRPQMKVVYKLCSQ